jgi:hypothetical protein
MVSSPDGAKRNPGTFPAARLSPHYASLHAGYKRIVMALRALTIGLALASIAATNVAAEEQRPAQAPAPAPQQQRLPVSLEQALYLIRSTLLTLNDANRTGNYTVLRDLSAPDFQARNTAADLAQIFSDLRRRNFDLFSVALAAPQLSSPPALDGNGMLRLTGSFPTQPLQINFDLLFQNAGGQWRLFGISVATTQVSAQPQPPPAEAPKAAPPKNAPAAKKK